MYWLKSHALTRTHAHTHERTHAHAEARMDAQTHGPPAHEHTHARAHALTHARTHIHTHARTSRRSRIFLKRGPLSCEVPSRRDSLGGGVVAEFFRGLQKPAQFSGGGVVAECFRGLLKPTRFIGGGGVVAELFSWSPKAGAIHWGGGSTRNFSLMGPFYMFWLSQRGARAPWPPL